MSNVQFSNNTAALNNIAGDTRFDDQGGSGDLERAGSALRTASSELSRGRSGGACPGGSSGRSETGGGEVQDLIERASSLLSEIQVLLDTADRRDNRPRLAQCGCELESNTNRMVGLRESDSRVDASHQSAAIDALQELAAILQGLLQSRGD